MLVESESESFGIPRSGILNRDGACFRFHTFMYTVALKAMPYVTMDFERCKDSVSASIVDDIVTCDMGK